jgi:hypothetical protein
MIKFFIVEKSTNKILTVLDQLPEHLPDGYQALRYTGYVPLKYLECKEGAIIPKLNAPPQNEVLETNRTQAAKMVTDTAARLIQQAKSQYTFNIPGYDAIFEEKVAQAIDFMTTKGSDINKFPLLRSESKALGITGEDVARDVLYKKSQWLSNVSKIDELLIRGNHALANATDRHQVDAIKNQIITELLALN